MQNYYDPCLSQLLSLEDRRLCSTYQRIYQYNVDQFIRTIDEHDRKQFILVRDIARVMRDYYTTVQAVVVENWQLITQPRSEDAMPITF